MLTYTYRCKNEYCKNFNKTYIVEGTINQEHDFRCPECNKEGVQIFQPTNTIWNCPGAFGKSTK